MSTVSPTKTHRLRLGIAAAAVLLLAAQVGPAPAQATPPVGANARGGCRRDAVQATPFGQVYMRENGKSGVTRFRARFRLYVTDVTAGWNPPAREKTYSSARFPNDTSSYGDNLPRGAWHEWTVYDDSYRMDAKITFERPWRPDWNYTLAVARC